MLGRSKSPESPGTLPPGTNASAAIPLFGARSKARELAAEVDRLRESQERLGILDLTDLEATRAQLTGEVNSLRQQLTTERAALEAQLAQLRQDIVVTEETSILQEVGVYEYRHPLSDAMAYQAELARLKDQIKAMTRKDGGAVLGSTNWTVNGSAAQGRTMVRDFSKLMLRAYNAEADNMVRGLKPYKLDSAVERLAKVANTIVKLGKTMDIRISDAYHALRIRELELTADYLAHVAEAKEREREEKDRLREERKAQQEMQRERDRLEKERQHYQNAMAALLDQGEPDAAARMADELREIEKAIEDVDYRAANIRAGYVYVISNLGSFGERIVKIGMTRRIDPNERIRELGDASVPFKYDVHALFFSDDAVGIETKLHELLAERRVNRVNTRREFFYATPGEVKEHLAVLAGELLQYEDVPEALEFRQSESLSATG